MNCPRCGSELNVFIRRGIEMDTCPRCRGVWLDRGELDKLTEVESKYYSNRDDDDSGEYRINPQQGHRPPQRKGFFGRFFDFD